MQKRIGTTIAAFLGAVIVAAVAYAQPGLSFNKDATLTGTGTVASPIRVNTSTLAGTGLTTSGAGLAVGCGTGLTCAADSVSISSAVATTSGCSTDAIPVHDSTSGLGCSAWTDDGTDTNYTGSGYLVLPRMMSGLLDNLYITTGNGFHNKSILLDSQVVVSGDNSNSPSANRRAALELFSGRTSAHALNAGQTTGDIAIQSGASGGGFRHWISSKHDATAANNALRFWVNTGATAEVSSAPGTGNVEALALYGDGSSYFSGLVDASGGIATTTLTAAGTTLNSDRDIQSVFSTSTSIDSGNLAGTLSLGTNQTGGSIGIGGGGATLGVAAPTTFSSTVTATTSSSTFGDFRGNPISATGVTGTLNDWAPTGLSGAKKIRVTLSGNATINGITGGAAGREIEICSVSGTFTLAFAHQAGGSTAAYRLILPNNETWTMPTTNTTCASFNYDGTDSRWRMTAWSGSTFPSATFSGAVTATSTLDVNGNYNIGDAAGDTGTIKGSVTYTGGTWTHNGNLSVGTGNAVTVGSATTFNNNAHISTSGSDPTLSSCGSSPSIIGSDTAGTVTVGTGGTATACTITFATGFATNAPACQIQSHMATAISLYVSASSTSAITVTNADPPAAFPASGKFSYLCIGVP